MSILVPLPGNEAMARRLAALGGHTICPLEARHFPDGESYVRLTGPVRGETVNLICTLAQPDDQFLRLIFSAAAAREAGARQVRLVAPYLAYMRQDRRFADGEAVSARAFARLLSGAFDEVLTIDPHLHRIGSLSDIFSIPAIALHTAPLLAEWVRRNVSSPVLIGPDRESRQWVARVAALAGAPYAVLEKTREGDRSVKISLPDLAFAKDRQAVLVDDLISSGGTMMEAASRLKEAGFGRPLCLAVHGLFAQDAFVLLKAVCERVVTTDTVPHPSNSISVAPLLQAALS